MALILSDYIPGKRSEAEARDLIAGATDSMLIGAAQTIDGVAQGINIVAFVVNSAGTVTSLIANDGICCDGRICPCTPCQSCQAIRGPRRSILDRSMSRRRPCPPETRGRFCNYVNHAVIRASLFHVTRNSPAAESRQPERWRHPVLPTS